MGKKKNIKHVVYSTNPDFSYEFDHEETVETLPPNQQTLYVQLDRKQRGGKEVTLITNFIGTDEDLKDLGKTLKSKCGTGGSAKDSEIIVQGNNVQKIIDLLQEMGYKTKKKGG